MCLNTRFIGIMNDLSDNSCYVDDICDVQVVCKGRQRSLERLTPLKKLITLNLGVKVVYCQMVVTKSGLQIRCAFSFLTRIGCSAEHMCHLPRVFQKIDKGK